MSEDKGMRAEVTAGVLPDPAVPDPTVPDATRLDSAVLAGWVRALGSLGRGCRVDSLPARHRRLRRHRHGRTTARVSRMRSGSSSSRRWSG